MKKLIISTDSCNGQEDEFEKWVNKHYPDIETSIENTLSGGYYVDDELVMDNLWDQFNRQ
jgi:hypothetical protein